MQSGREDTLEERYAIKLCFKHGKNATETYRMLQTAFRPSCMNRASVFEWGKRFKEGRESVGDDERRGRSKEVSTPELIVKGLGLGLLCWGFKGFQEEILSEEASCTLQIGSVAFPPGQCTSPQLHPYHRLFDQDGHLDNWRDERGCGEGHWHAHTWGLPEVNGTVQVHCSRKRLLRRGLEFYVCTINKSAHTKKVWKLIQCSSYIYIYIYIYIYESHP